MVWLFGSLFLACSGGMSRPGELKAAEIELTFQTRHAATGAIQRAAERVDPHRVGVIAVDVWNYHWCKTATMRVDAMVPRIDQALNAARDLGMTVMLCPSDVVDNYVGYPQREAVFALPRVAVPSLVERDVPAGSRCRGLRLRPRAMRRQLWMGRNASRSSHRPG